MDLKEPNKKPGTILSILLVIIIGVIFILPILQTYFLDSQKSFNKGLYDFEITVNQKVSDLSVQLDNIVKNGFHKTITNQNNIDSREVVFLQFKNDQLTNWSGNKLPIDDVKNLPNGIHLLNHHWYLIQSVVNTEFKTVGIFLIKNEYRHENSYLKNTFNPVFYLGKNWHLTNEQNKYSFQKVIKNNFKNEVYLGFEPLNTGFSILFIAIEVLLILTAILLLYNLAKLSVLGLIVSSIVFLLLRLVMMHELFLLSLKSTSLFLPQIFAASDSLPSLGDLILHLLFYAVLFNLWKNKIFEVRFQHSILTNFSIFIMIAILFLGGAAVNYLLYSLLNYSQVKLNLSEFIRVDVFTIIIYLVFAFVFFLYLQLTKVILKYSTEHISFQRIVFFLLFLGCFFYFFLKDIDQYVPIVVWVIPLFFLVLYKNTKSDKNQVQLINYLPELLFFSFLLSVNIEVNTLEKQKKEEVQFLNNKAQERDFIAEFLLNQLAEEIASNHDVEDLDIDYVSKIISLNNLSNYLKRFDFYVQKSLNTDEVVQKGDYIPYTKIDDKIFRKLDGGVITYKIEFSDNTNHISIVFSAKELPEGQGFPMLLANKAIEGIALSDFQSFAKYRNGFLIDQKGTFPYPKLNTKFLVADSIESCVVHGEKFTHKLLNKNQSLYVLTTPIYSINSLFSKLSYVVLAFTVLLFIVLSTIRLIQNKTILPKSFSGKFQYALLFILFFSTLIIAYGSIYFLKEQYRKESINAISEKVKSVKKILEENNFEKLRDINQIQEQLTEVGGLFYTDINLFDSNGILKYTTQKNIFESGLISNLVNPKVFHDIFLQKYTLSVEIEDIESMSYLSAYVPIYNEKNELLYCLNLPYFAKTDELQSGINGFLLTLINMYLLLTALSIVIALFISNRISKPLQLLKDKMAKFNFLNKGEAINWESDDEIGSLVREYNRMVSELLESANQLAQAEREGAWKEMAQQVAHEIKNPLTPMKLNLQHLQMKWSGLSTDEKDSAVKKLANNLVEQIDTLSAIANQFSRFAQLQDADLVPTEIQVLIKNSVNLYHENEGVKVVFNSNYSDADILVMADKDQLVRVFNNLIKNAIQAIPEGKKGRVELSSFVTNKQLIVKVKDNGAGISPELKAKIFQPKFTTKNSGMGLGLAMVKQMLESSGASIDFESEEGVGTTFKITFDLYEKV